MYDDPEDMFGNVNSNIISSSSQNDPSIAFAANSIVGNMQFNIVAPSIKGVKVQNGYPQIPYVGLEWLIYFAQASNPMTNPVFSTGGSNTGEQAVSGQITMSDSAGTTRYSQGTITNSSANTGG
jgi:hypothetical protein